MKVRELSEVPDITKGYIPTEKVIFEKVVLKMGSTKIALRISFN